MRFARPPTRGACSGARPRCTGPCWKSTTIFTAPSLPRLPRRSRAYGDLRLAAEALHQHPNTVRYRLRKAKDVLGMPDSPDREFAFLLGLVYLDYTNPLLQP